MIRRLKGKRRAIEVLRLPGQPQPAVSIAPPDFPYPSRKRLGLIAVADHIAAQPWCTADAATVLASLRSLRP